MTDPTEEQRIEATQLYVKQLQAFYIHVGVFAAGMLVIFVVNLITNLSAGIAGDWSAWWSIWAFLGWGAGIAVHGLVVRAEPTDHWHRNVGAAPVRQIPLELT